MVSHYRLIEKLGQGGMGEVYLAEDVKHGRRVALKTLSEKFTRDERSLQRFKKEASAILKLNHPNILTVYELGEDESSYFLVTEYIKGDTLRDRLAQDGMTIDEALGVSIQVARALEAAQDEGIVHRDIKPENIMLRHDRVGAIAWSKSSTSASPSSRRRARPRTTRTPSPCRFTTRNRAP